MIRHPQFSSLFPYTTLFRSIDLDAGRLAGGLIARGDADDAVRIDREGDFDLRHAARRAADRSHLLDRRSEEHTSELQSHVNLVCRLLLEKKKRDIRAIALHR